MLAPEVDPAGHEAAREWLAGDVLLGEAGGEERGDRVVDLAVRGGRADDGHALEAHSEAARAGVHGRERQRVDLAAVGDRADPSARWRVAQECAAVIWRDSQRGSLRGVFSGGKGDDLGVVINTADPYLQWK